MLYTAGSKSLALLEALVYLPQKNFPDDFCMVTIYIPDNISVQVLNVAGLPGDWR